MRSDLELISDESNYVVVRDVRIPFAMDNIIFRNSALKDIANYYFNKYGIIIQVASTPSKIDKLADDIHVFLNDTKQQFPAANQIGFIFISNDDPDDTYGHALPMIWQREDAREHLFFLDTTQYLSDLSQPCSIDFRCRLAEIMPQLQLWGIVGGRQRDYSSCYTDALVMLKDGLRVPSFKALVENRVNVTVSTPALKIFFAPELLLKTAQIHSYVEKSMGTEQPVTLAAFRQQYDLPILVKEERKFFGTYTLFKPEHYLRILHEQAEKEEFARIEAAFKSAF